MNPDGFINKAKEIIEDDERQYCEDCVHCYKYNHQLLCEINHGGLLPFVKSSVSRERGRVSCDEMRARKEYLVTCPGYELRSKLQPATIRVGFWKKIFG